MKTMTPLEILIAAREWLTPPERWTKGELWRDEFGRDCISSKACSGCTVGAISKFSPLEFDEEYHQAKVIFKKAIKGESIEVWNDAPERTHEEVLAAFDRAIELAKEAK